MPHANYPEDCRAFGGWCDEGCVTCHPTPPVEQDDYEPEPDDFRDWQDKQ